MSLSVTGAPLFHIGPVVERSRSSILRLIRLRDRSDSELDEARMDQVDIARRHHAAGVGLAIVDQCTCPIEPV